MDFREHDRVWAEFNYYLHKHGYGVTWVRCGETGATRYLLLRMRPTYEVLSRHYDHDSALSMVKLLLGGLNDDVRANP
jgi:hypothetical protein